MENTVEAIKSIKNENIHSYSRIINFYVWVFISSIECIGAG